jgi:hypothetical protein
VEPGYEMYATVTPIVHTRLHQFRYPQKIVETIPVFAKAGEDPLEDHIRGERERVPPLWAKLYYGKRRAHSPIEDLGDFWVAHIGNDLRGVYQRTNTEPKHRPDADKINGMLEDAAWEIMRKSIAVPDFIGRLGVGLVMRDIVPLRARAFDDGQALIAAKNDDRKIQAILSAPRKAGMTEHPATRMLFDVVVAAFRDNGKKPALRGMHDIA